MLENGALGDSNRFFSRRQSTDPVGLQARALIRISRFALQKHSRESGYYSLFPDPAEVQSKIRGFDVLTPGCLQWGGKINPSSEPDGASCMLGEARQCYRSPPVVLITVHDKGIHWSGRREESRGDPCCLRRVGGETLCSPMFGRL